MGFPQGFCGVVQLQLTNMKEDTRREAEDWPFLT